MSTARFQLLKGDAIGIVRVYPGEQTEPPAPYKFFTVAVLHGDRAEILGLAHASITARDVSSIANELRRVSMSMGRELKTAYWKHNGECHEYHFEHANHNHD